MNSYSRSSARQRSIGTHVLLCIGAFIMLVPFIWMVLTSLKSLAETMQVPPTLIPTRWQWRNYVEVWTALPFARLYLNSSVSAVCKTFGQLLFCSMAAYAFARIQFKGRTVLFVLCLSVLMVPHQVALIPQYLMMKYMGLLNTLPALFIPGLFSGFGTFFLRQFFMTLPRELDDAARIDGCNHWQIYWHIMLPLVRSGLIALGIFVSLWTWNDLMWPLIVNTSPTQMTVTAGIASFQGEYYQEFQVLMAGAVMATLPMIALFVVMQRRIIEGIQLTGSKG